jgi:cell wall assembly regulator SMI1
MEKILHEFKRNIVSKKEALDALRLPATSQELDNAEQELSIMFPEDFRALYQWHNGDRGTLYLYGAYRISPLSEILDLYRFTQKSSSKEMDHISDDSGVFKDCIANPKWIQFADNGGNTVVLSDMDPGKQGTPGQLLEVCDGETECRFSGVKAFITDITNRISTGQIGWDEESGCFL